MILPNTSKFNIVQGHKKREEKIRRDKKEMKERWTHISL